MPTLRSAATAWLVVSVLLTIFMIWFMMRRGQCAAPASAAAAAAEGFANTDAPQTELNNVLLKTMSTLKRMSGYLTDPVVWKERLTFYTMTPGELARLHLQIPQ